MAFNVFTYEVTIITAKIYTSEGLISNSPLLELFMMPNHSAADAAADAVPGPRRRLPEADRRSG